MADKLNDQEIVNELKRFGESVKVPIDKKKRPILIKKLNHYYAKENPPPKRGKSTVKATRKTAVVEEFSDESQDESESASFLDRATRGRNLTKNNSVNRSPASQRLRARLTDNGANSSPNSSFTTPRLRNAKNKKSTNAYQMEIFPNEFSDEDTADESVYVEQNSIGINTSLAYDDDDEEINVSNYAAESPVHRMRMKNRLADISTISQQRNTSLNNIGAKRHISPYSKGESSQFISKTILTLVAIFFVILAICYVYIRRDIIFSREAALTQTGYHKF